MQELVFEPIYYGERLRVLNPLGDTGFITFWSPIPTILKKLTETDPALAAGEGRVGVVGNLYGDGMYAMLCNLLNNPQMRHLVSVGQDLSGCAPEIEAFLTRGTEPVDVLGKSMRRIIGTNRFLPDVAEFDEAALRQRLTYKHFGLPSVEGLATTLRDYLAQLPEASPSRTRKRVDIPTPSAEDFSFQPSEVGGHQVIRRRPLEAWRELVVRALRFGRPVNLQGKFRLELQNAKVVITEPADDRVEDLDAVGFSMERFRIYQKRILEPNLPENISYTYGNRLRNYYKRNGKTIDTLAVAVDRLKSGPETRHAYITIWDTQNDLLSEGESDSSLPCLTTIFFRKNQGKLSLFATYRSHNLLTAWLENVYGLMAIQKFVADGAGMEPGSITVISHSLGADPNSTRFAVGQSIAAGWDRDDDLDPATGKPVLREDPQGYFALSIDETRGFIIADHMYSGVLVKRYEGKRAEAIEAQVSADMGISLISHAMWFGRELARQETKLDRLSKKADRT